MGVGVAFFIVGWLALGNLGLGIGLGLAMAAAMGTLTSDPESGSTGEDPAVQLTGKPDDPANKESEDEYRG